MKVPWFFVILLLAIVAVFSVQNAELITVRFLSWEINMSAALVIQLAAILGAITGIGIGLRSRQSSKPKAVETRAHKSDGLKPAGVEPPTSPALQTFMPPIL